MFRGPSRLLTNAIFFPSGEKSGWRSPPAFFVSWVRPSPSTPTAKTSESHRIVHGLAGLEIAVDRCLGHSHDGERRGVRVH
jgi:hypothetical protein